MVRAVLEVVVGVAIGVVVVRAVELLGVLTVLLLVAIIEFLAGG